MQANFMSMRGVAMYNGATARRGSAAASELKIRTNIILQV